MFVLDDPPLNPDGPTARRWLQQELSKGDYAEHQSLIQRITSWLAEHLGGVGVGGVNIPWYVVAVILAVVLVVLGVYSWRRFTPSRPSPRNPSSAPGAVFDTATTADAAGHRSEAQRLLASDASAALVAAYRALVMRGDERGYLQVSASTTVGDVEAALVPALPQHAPAIRATSASFSRVRYGGGSATVDEVQAVLDLDDLVAASGVVSR